MKEKIKSLVKSKYFIPTLCCAPFGIIVLVLVFTLLWYLFLGEFVITTWVMIKTHWRALLAIPALIFGFFAFLRYVLPVIFYIFSRIGVYLSLAVFCAKNGINMKLERAPFASLFGMSEKADVTLADENGVHCIHFVDVVFRFRRVVVFDADGGYIVTPTTATGATLVGAALGSLFSDEPLELTNQKKVLLDIAGTRKRRIPEFENKKYRHLVVLQTNPVDARYDNGLENYEISSGTKVGTAQFYYLRRLKKELRKR